jgi:hypothetical protein
MCHQTQYKSSKKEPELLINCGIAAALFYNSPRLAIDCHHSYANYYNRANTNANTIRSILWTRNNGMYVTVSMVSVCLRLLSTMKRRIELINVKSTEQKFKV